MKRLVALLAVCLSIGLGISMGFGTTAHAGPGHYVSGVEGIKAATLPPEGFYWRMYNVFYNADSMRDNSRNGNSDFDLSVYALVNRFIYSSPYKLFGANFVFDIVIPVQYTDISMRNMFSDNKFGLGDITIEPFLLAWHGDRYDAAFGVGVYLPTGEFKASRPASPGKGFWTVMLTAGGTLYFDDEKSWSASILSRYEIHTEQDHTNLTPGNDLSFEWGVGKNFNKLVDVGVAGYCRWQVTDDSGPGRNLREEVYAVGPEVGFAIPAWGASVSLRSLWEFGGKNTSQGNITSITLTKAF